MDDSVRIKQATERRLFAGAKAVIFLGYYAILSGGWIGASLSVSDKKGETKENKGDFDTDVATIEKFIRCRSYSDDCKTRLAGFIVFSPEFEFKFLP